MRSLIGLFILFLAFACNRPQRENVDFNEWGEYWFQGKAEINSYSLTQYRYGEAREGEAVLIFVAEDFSRKKQVKLDDPSQAGRDKISVLKMNHTREFITGIYPYHMMLSAFTPTKEASQGLKFTASSQEWCGQSFTQLNLNSGDSYDGELFSYFEEEGSYSFSLNGIAEDDLWNLIRINPNQVPIGSVNMWPSLIHQRLTHREFISEEVFIRTTDVSENRSQLEVTYSSGNRVLRINYEKEFPYEILGWEEEQTNKNGQKELTKAERKGTKVIDYWNRKALEDEFLRDELKLNK
ncbi:hypothetical protein [Cyclobacterium amurskyense]|uniref:Septum formation inhibitor Maf n=1 Tax=Cyclobacterium amurskyense TaxID=320787 RepID=A0A0H4PJ45_9BACT|nr:hypothetical protein [Cyclobacterium amurskyense]AKP53050.1 hypothetical protein CA2015_3673 [Cyclobacterium amurskyense]|tara:strand:- start:5111 stop:5995 length:885 start_codon:yes stop_codon:yes gene_type:complete